MVLCALARNITTQSKQRIEIISRVFDAVKLNLPDCLKQECLKENISVDEVILLFTSLEAKC